MPEFWHLVSRGARRNRSPAGGEFSRQAGNQVKYRVATMIVVRKTSPKITILLSNRLTAASPSVKLSLSTYDEM